VGALRNEQTFRRENLAQAGKLSRTMARCSMCSIATGREIFHPMGRLAPKGEEQSRDNQNQ
jgi:hypothetical protein